MEKQRNKKLWIIIISAILMILTSIMSLQAWVLPARAESTQGSNTAFDTYTDSDYLLNNNNNKIFDYAKSTSNSSIAGLYRSTSTFSTVVQHGQRTNKLTATGNDPIVQIIPEELFKKAGKTFYIGKEYGFIVDTVIEKDNACHSLVMVFDIDNSIESLSNNGHVQFVVMPLFQRAYVYITKSGKYSLRAATDYQLIDYSSNTLDCVLQNTSSAIVPEPLNSTISLGGTATSDTVRYEETNKYYLSDVSCSASLYNEQHLNAFDLGYNVDNDNGSFFTQLDYAYEGKTVERKKINWGEQFISMTTMALGFTKAAPFIAPFLTFYDFYELMKGFDTSPVFDSQLKKFTYTAMANSKSDQIREYGALIKDATVRVGEINGLKLILGNNDSVTCDFQIGDARQGNIPWSTRMYTRWNMKAVNFDEEPPLVAESNYGFSIRSGEVLSINEGINNEYVLNNGTNRFTFTPSRKAIMTFLFLKIWN